MIPDRNRLSCLLRRRGGPALLTVVDHHLNMPSHRSRSRSVSPERERDGPRSRSPKRHDVDLPYDAKSISESDYFLKSDEFRLWLREEKRKVCIQPSALRLNHPPHSYEPCCLPVEVF